MATENNENNESTGRETTFVNDFVDQISCKSNIDGKAEFESALLIENSGLFAGLGAAAYFLKKLILKKSGKNDFSLRYRIAQKKAATV